MYTLKCKKDFDMQLEIPDFSTRYSEILQSKKKNIIYIKDVFDNSTFRYRTYNVMESMKNNEKYSISTIDNYYDEFRKCISTLKNER